MTGPYTASPYFVKPLLKNLVKLEHAVVECSVASSKCLRMWLILAIYFCSEQFPSTNSSFHRESKGERTLGRVKGRYFCPSCCKGGGGDSVLHVVRVASEKGMVGIVSYMCEGSF